MPKANLTPEQYQWLRSRRREQRGAVFVEALIVCAMLMTMMAGGLFFHRMYAAKFRAIRDARLASWQPAEEGCASLLGVGQLFNLMILSDCQDDTCTIGGLSTGSTEPPGWLAVGAEASEMSHDVTAHARVGGGTFSPSAYNRVICNEEPQSDRGDLISIGEYIFDAVIP